MRLSNLFWIVALFIVLRADSTRPHPRMFGKRNELHLKPENEYVDANLDDQMKRLGQYNINAKVDDGYPNNNQCDTMPQPCDYSSTSVPPTPSRTVDCDELQQTLIQQQQQQQQLQLQMQQQQCDQQPCDQQQQQQQPQQPQQFAPSEMDDSELRGKELRKLVQHLYVAQARVQLEATEIHKAQAVATSAQSQLENSANNVRTITATLHNAQQEVAASAIRAQIAQLQLAAHDQLLFAARQDVDSLSSQVVGLQAAEGIVQPKLTVDLHALLDKLRQPLQHFDRPTPVPMIITMPPLIEALPEPVPNADAEASGISNDDANTGIWKKQDVPSSNIKGNAKQHQDNIVKQHVDYT